MTWERLFLVKHAKIRLREISTKGVEGIEPLQSVSSNVARLLGGRPTH